MRRFERGSIQEEIHLREGYIKEWEAEIARLQECIRQNKEQILRLKKQTGGLDGRK